MTNLLNSLGSELSHEIASVANTVKYHDDQIIHSRGASKPGLSIVKSGIATVGMFGHDGKFISVALLGQGECFGEFTLFADLPRTHDILALGETQVHQLSVAQFERLADKHPQIIKALLKITLLRNYALLGALDSIRRLPLLERTASNLLSLLRTSHIKTEIKCTHDQLAFNLGVSRVSIGKALRKLEKAELIKLAYGRILFPNPGYFKNWVNEHCNFVSLSRP